MATIQSSIKLTDGMTPALRSMNKALGIVINSFESMQRASARGVDVNKIRQARSEWAKSQVHLNNIEREINENRIAQDKFNKSVRKGTSDANKLWGKLKDVAKMYIGFQSLMGIVNASDQLAMTKSRINLMTGDLDKTNEVMDKIYESAQRSRAGYYETADAVAKLKQRTGKLFGSFDETIAFTETLNKMFAIAGTQPQEIASAMLQLTQAMGSGVLRGEEFNAIFEASPNILETVADYMNVPIGQLRNMAAEGKITSAIIKNAIFDSIGKVNEQFEGLAWTWRQVWTVMWNYVKKVAEPILEQINKIANSEKFRNFANAFANAIKVVIDVLGYVFDLALDVFNVFYENWSFIGPIVYGIAGAFLMYKGALMAVWTWQKLCAIATGALTIAKIIGTFATHGITAATARWAKIQLGLNGALWACPLTWIVLAIIAVIVVIYLVIAAINKFAGTSYSATGFVAGCFRALGAIIWNVVAYIWNAVASFVEFFANAFKHPIYSVKKMFVSLATNFLDLIISMTKGWDKFATNMVNVIIKAVNGIIDGWNWLADSWIGRKLGLETKAHLSERKSITSDLENAKASLQASVANQPADYWTAPRMEMKNVGESFDKGYEWGKGVADGLSNSGSKLDALEGLWGKGAMSPANGLNDVGKALSGGYGSPSNDALTDYAKQIADNTSDIAANEEDISYMRDLAEREAINRYTMTDLKIEMTNNNKINSNMDLDKVVNYLQQKVYEGVLATADGVHF